jgi:opacity protein-like surface antigen
MKIKTLAAIGLLAVASGAMADEDTHPFYVRGQIGAGRAYFNDTTILKRDDNAGYPGDTLNGVNKAKLAGRVAVGYKFGNTFSTELGYTQIGTVNGSLNSGNTRWSTLDVSSNAVDALVKASLPITDNIAVFGGAGAALYSVKYEMGSSGNVGRSTSYAEAVRPEFTVGSSYKVNENVAIDASFTQILGKGNVKDLAITRDTYLPDAQLLAVGASYSF